jgi:hypothetical protein
MIEKMNPMKVGLVFGLFFSIVHLLWALLIASQYAQPFMQWILKLHFLSIPYTILPFNFMTAIMLVIVMAIIGYIFGFLFAWTVNSVYGRK